MKNKVQLITYAHRFGNKGISEIHSFLSSKLKGVFDGGIHLLPFYTPIDGADAGYDPIDHTEIDPQVGTWDDIKKLSGEYDIMADLIVNHTSIGSREFKDVKKNGSMSEYFDLFLTKDKVFGNEVSDEAIKKIYRPRPNLPFTSIKLDNEEQFDFWTTFTSDQLDIDVNHPKGIEYLYKILYTFHFFGIKIIRLDAAGYAIKKAGTSCFMLPETYDFIRDITDKANVLGIEVLVEIHSHYQLQVEIAKRVDYVYDFALPPLVLHTIYNKSTVQLKNWLEISPRNAITVLDTHDGIGVIDVAGNGTDKGLLSDDEVNSLVDNIHKNSGNTSRKATGAAASNLDIYQVNCTFYEALGKNDFNYLVSRVIQFFSPGIPQVYYVGLLAGENDMELLEETQVGRDINRHFYSFEEVEESMKREVVKALIALIKFRNTHESFNGDFKLRKSAENALLIEWHFNGEWSRLHLDFVSGTCEISFSNEGKTQVLDFSYLQHNAPMSFTENA